MDYTYKASYINSTDSQAVYWGGGGVSGSAFGGRWIIHLLQQERTDDSLVLKYMHIHRYPKVMLRELLPQFCWCKFTSLCCTKSINNKETKLILVSMANHPKNSGVFQQPSCYSASQLCGLAEEAKLCFVWYWGYHGSHQQCLLYTWHHGGLQQYPLGYASCWYPLTPVQPQEALSMHWLQQGSPLLLWALQIWEELANVITCIPETVCPHSCHCSCLYTNSKGLEMGLIPMCECQWVCSIFHLSLV